MRARGHDFGRRAALGVRRGGIDVDEELAGREIRSRETGDRFGLVGGHAGEDDIGVARRVGGRGGSAHMRLSGFRALVRAVRRIVEQDVPGRDACDALVAELAREQFADFAVADEGEIERAGHASPSGPRAFRLALFECEP